MPSPLSLLTLKFARMKAGVQLAWVILCQHQEEEAAAMGWGKPGGVGGEGALLVDESELDEAGALLGSALAANPVDIEVWLCRPGYAPYVMIVQVLPLWCRQFWTVNVLHDMSSTQDHMHSTQTCAWYSFAMTTAAQAQATLSVGPRHVLRHSWAGQSCASV
jgi:hypothetical protein